jgi:hypothetical protein
VCQTFPVFSDKGDRPTAHVIAQDAVWYLNTALRDMRTLNLVALSTGKIGGALGGDGVIYSGLCDLTTAALGPIRTNLLPKAVQLHVETASIRIQTLLV